MHQETKSSPAGILMPSGRPADSSHHQHEDRDEEKAGEIAGKQIKTVEEHIGTITSRRAPPMMTQCLRQCKTR